MRITLFSIINSLVISSFLIYFVGMFLKNKGCYKYSSIKLIYMALSLILIKLIFPIEIPLLKIYTYKTNLDINAIQFQNNIVWHRYLILIWLLGIIVFGFLYFLRILKTIKLYKRIYETSKHKKISDYMNTYNDYDVIFSLYIDYPCVIMAYKTIVVPIVLEHSKEMGRILVHESKHIENKDFIVKFVFDILCILYWWFYPVYLLKRYVDLFLEIRVDHQINRYKNAEERIDYAHSLVNISKVLISKNNQLELSNSFNKSNLSYRINYLFTEKVNKKRNRLLVIGLLMLSCITSFLYITIEIKDNIPEIITIPTKKIELTGSLSEDDEILLFNDGAFFHGEIEIKNGWFNVEKYNSDTDFRAATINELNEKVESN